MINRFLWAGRSWVARATVLLPKSEGRRELISVEAQYNALTSNLMLWVMAEGEHPLCQILQSHIKTMSERRWGIADLTWLVTKCGTMQLEGSAPWRNLCTSWMGLKAMLHLG